MLSSRNRFHRRNHVLYVHRRGKSVRGRNISLRFVDGQDHDDYRVAVVVSKKVDKRASVRNRIRRRLYAFIRTHEPQLRPEVDVVLSVFSSDVATAPAEDVSRELSGLLKSAGILKS